MYQYNKKLSGNANYLRKNMTPEEKKLWFTLLHRLPMRVKRQFVIQNYIVDFYIPKAKTVIEIDGIQHMKPEHKTKDNLRDTNLSQFGISVLRYKNSDINDNFPVVARDILKHLGLKYTDLKPKDN